MAAKPRASTTDERRGSWWQHGVVYQIYPRSFQDTNGDGVGDLRGIIDRLDYLNDGSERSLGIDAIWLSPTFPSPMADFGYDVADYESVHPDFGDLATMDELIEQCHRRGMRLLLDYVPNHSSDRHPWFIESRSSRTNPKRNWYYWRDAKPDGSPPNNWLSAFGGPAWTYDEATGQYYLHSFLKEQPDLNWRNPEVVRAMHDVLRFWLRRGIDGFRIDVMGAVLKDPQLRDNPPNPAWRPESGLGERASQIRMYNTNWPDVFEAVRGIRGVVDEFPETMIIGEVFGPPETLAQYYGGEALNGLHLAFNFHLIGGYGTAATNWSASEFRRIVDEAEAGLPKGAWPNFVLGNHDQPRLVTRYGKDGHGQERARAAAMLLLTLRGTPFLYYGDEIGMADVQIPEEKLQDPARFRAIGRDSERTPMQWANRPGDGFTTGEPWLPLGDLFVNVAEQDGDPDSLLNLYRRLLWLRRRTPALHEGSYRPIESAPDGVFAYLRALGDQRLLIALNFEGRERALDFGSIAGRGTIACSTKRTRDGEQVSARLQLEPWEGCIVRPE